jgi:tetratricopeptide (TPR) repeat protein
MHISRNFCNARSLLILCLLATTTCGCSTFFRARAAHRGLQESKEHYPGRGIRISEVHPGSAAELAGLKTMDVIFRYGDFEIVDDASFFTARDTYDNGLALEVPLVIWRAGKVRKISVPPGKLGIESVEDSPVAHKFSSLMNQLVAQQQILGFESKREFKNSYIPPEKIVAEAKSIIDQAEREATLTPNQILVARIYMIPDDASPEDLKRQSGLLTQLISTQPASYVAWLGQDRFFENKHYRPAVECLKRHLEIHPDDVSIRLNLGVAYNHIGMFTEAEAAADYVLDNELPLAEHGYVVAYGVKAMVALSRGDYAKTILLSEKNWELEQNQSDIERLMLAAAQTGDVQKVTEASRKYKEVLPKEFEKRKLQLAAVEALALVKGNQRDRARELTRAWKDTDNIESRLKASWKTYPGVSDIWTNWNELTRN